LSGKDWTSSGNRASLVPLRERQRLSRPAGSIGIERASEIYGVGLHIETRNEAPEQGGVDRDHVFKESFGVVKCAENAFLKK
jgi:hypothetical protein